MNFEPTAEEYPVLDPGLYAKAIFDRIEEPDEVGQYGPYINWFFIVTTEDGPVEVTSSAAN